MAAPIRLGVIGGSGLYDIKDAGVSEPLTVHTPYGPPSSPVVVGEIGGVRVGFIARHGRGHRLTPTEVPYRANIWALKSLGAEFLLSVSAVGSLREDIHPLDMVVPDQYIDRTRHRPDTFFGDGLVVHVSLADPTCAAFGAVVAQGARQAGATVHEGGTYMCMEGPQFSTRAESNVYRMQGASVIGMTNMQEVRLAREAELCFSTLAHITDYDCWKLDEPPVTVEAVVARVERNAAVAREAVRYVAAHLPAERACACGRALDGAVISNLKHVPAATRARLAPLLARLDGGC